MTLQPPIRLLARGMQQTRIAGHFIAVVCAGDPVGQSVSVQWLALAEPAGLGLSQLRCPTTRHRLTTRSTFLAYVPARCQPAAQPAPTPAPVPALALAWLLPSQLSFSIETLQVFLPTRVASNLDIFNNSGGACSGGNRRLAAGRQNRSCTGWRCSAAALVPRRYARRLWTGGVALWFITQLDPSIPLFGVIDAAAWPATAFGADQRSIAVPAHAGGLNAGLNLLTLSLLLTVLLAQRRFMVRGIAILITLTLYCWKLALAGMLQTVCTVPVAQLADRHRPAGYPCCCRCCCALRRRWRALLTVLALCFNLIVDALWPLRETPLSALKLFRWSGQQCSTSTAWHTIADIWPFLALLFLLRYFQLERARQARPGSRGPARKSRCPRANAPWRSVRTRRRRPGATSAIWIQSPGLLPGRASLPLAPARWQPAAATAR